MMQISVLFFGALKELAGGTAVIDMPEGATIADLLRLILQEKPGMRAYSRSIAIAVNQQYERADTVLHDQDEVAFLPPVSGGSVGTTPGAAQFKVALVRSRIEAELIIEAMKEDSDGAVVVFEGIVRDNSRGRRTTHLEYEAYDGMALQHLERLAREAGVKFEIRDAAVVHRLGVLQVGETSVLIVVASAHRRAAFDACHWMIDELKRTVPIWKKEFFEDGAVWADGEPFPPELGIQS